MKDILIVVDFQNDFVSPDGQVAKMLGNNVLLKSQVLKIKLQKLIDSFHKTNKLVLFLVSDYNIKHYKGCFKRIRTKMKSAYGEAATKGTWGHKLYQLKSKTKDSFIVKHYFDGFYKTKLENFLQKNKIKNVYICGVNTDVCVFHTAIGSSIRGYKTFVIRDATETITSNKKIFLDYLNKYVGVQMVYSSQIY